ncbi:uncharacterized protein DEA37_0008109 [Paragonimus westermani]|uniref:Uncharacterized protein n=1 Tax=Paragonimus westermani TaxID=34504 RepID=A0A5J4NGW0_9TREM|nr:uncharacterized protein DEA37_0008109 [Paragonimus westermani]
MPEPTVAQAILPMLKAENDYNNLSSLTALPLATERFQLTQWEYMDSQKTCPSSGMLFVWRMVGVLRLSGELPCEVSPGDAHLKGSCYLTDQPELDWVDVINLFETPINRWSNGGTIDYDPLILRYTTSPFGIDGLGFCVKTNAVLHLLSNARPGFRLERSVPSATLPLVDRELGYLQEASALKSVNYSSWVAPIVVVKKPKGVLRIDTDFLTGLSEYASVSSASVR